MKIALLALLLSVSISYADELPTFATPEQILTHYQVDTTKAPTIDSKFYNFSACSNLDGFYEINLTYTAKADNKDVTLMLSIQALNENNQKRIADAIQANIATKGLPACMMGEKFEKTSPVTQRDPIVYQPLLKNSGVDCAIGEIDIPLTACFDVDPLYP